MPQRVIKLNLYTVTCITAREYEAVRAEVHARIMTGSHGVGDIILARILLDNEYRYKEIRHDDEV